MNEKTRSQGLCIKLALIAFGVCYGVWKVVEINLPGSVSNSVVDQSVLSIDLNTGEQATLSSESRKLLDETDREQRAVSQWLSGQQRND